MSKNTNTDFTLRPIEDLKDHHFFIPDYQRGYKWDVQQVLDLLNDIDEFDKSRQGFYCLQPLAVKKRAEKDYEVIDGQQRLTTVHIILSIISENNHGIYTLDYATRTHSKDLLANLIENFGAFSVAFDSDIDKLRKVINEQWQSYIDKKKATSNESIEGFDNIDFYHIFMAFLTVRAWFEGKSIDKKTFSEKLMEDTQFIWYNETNADNAKTVFRNLNSGKVPLTNAELIKALFVNSLKDANKEIQQLKQTNLATEWDNIETTLQNDDFWYFIHNAKADDYQTRIDYLFELKEGKNSKDELHTYHKYADLAKKNNGGLEEKEWKSIKDLFLKLREWYEQPSWYHLIGYLTASWDSVKALLSINDIIEKSKGKTKGEFWNELMGIIRKKLSDEGGELLLKELNYEDHSKPLNRVLLLHNIATYDKDKSGVRFPFDRFKITRKGKQRLKWSLEHIHAQQSDKVETVGELREWMGEDDMEELVKSAKEELTEESFDILSENVAKLKVSCKKKESTQKVSDEQKEWLKEIEEQLKIHQLWNMALLDKQTNSGLGKKSFKGKREAIIKKIENGSAFIPIGTQNVFLKAYSKKVEQLTYWSYKDREDYLKDIEKTITNYLKKTPTNND